MLEGRERISVAIRPAGCLPGQSFDFVCLVSETEKRKILGLLRSLSTAPAKPRQRPVIAKITPCPTCRAKGYRAGVSVELCGTCNGECRCVEMEGGKKDAVPE